MNGQVAAKTYYFDDFELRVAGNHTHKYHYLEEGLLTYMLDSSLTDHYYLLTDNVGSVTHIVSGEGGTKFDAGYEAWGRQHVTKNDIGFFRGYGGHEMLSKYRLVNMDGRLYDYALGRFLSPDNYVQEPGNSQNFNRYSYCLNNPLKYTDPTGDSFLAALLTSTIIGAATSASSYSLSALLTDLWNPHNFCRSMAIGAFSGALSAGLGQLSSTLGISKVLANSIGYKMLSQTTNSILTNALFGNNIRWSDVGGIVAGSLVSLSIPDFKPSFGTVSKNFFGETIHNTIKGYVSGFAQGAAKGIIERNNKYVFQGALGGALSGFSRTVALNALMGTPYDVSYEQGNHSQSGVIRKGGLVGAAICNYYERKGFYIDYLSFGSEIS